MNLPIALQLYSVREDMEADFRGTLEKVKALGYDGVEFAGLYGKEPEEIRMILDELALVPLSAHIPYLDLIADTSRIISDYAKIGCAYIAVPYLTEEYRPGTVLFESVIENIKKIGEAANRCNMTLLYHNHDFEFVKINGKYALDVLYEAVPSTLLQTEIDTCWVGVAGENPSDYLLKYEKRAPVVHLKDFFLPGKKPEQMYELIGIEEDKKEERSTFEFRPLGKGMQDMPSILEASEKAGAKWVVVEQDMPSMGFSSMECAKVSMNYLKSL